MKNYHNTIFCAAILAMLISCQGNKDDSSAPVTDHAIREVWSKDKASSWYEQWGWLRGADFIPSSAINQLEMWQAETFDSATINRELGWAESIGMNSMRVYLHHLAWEVDSVGFKDRMETYLTIAGKHHISTIFVFFDDCWNPEYGSGKQPDPKPGIHNSGWVRDPGDRIYRDTAMVQSLEHYVKDVMDRFRDDKRIVLWDVYNEPGNSGYGNKSMALLELIFRWGREVNPSQPLSAGIWSSDLEELNIFQLANSDVVTYHNYSEPAVHKEWIDSLRTFGRPLICTEYMARSRNSLFGNIMPMLKEEHVGAYNWGLVSGKTNTKYAWDTPMPGGEDPKPWFHDIFRPDGTPYDTNEVELIKSLTAK